MVDLNEDQAIALIEPMAVWHEECLAVDNIRVQKSIQIQLFNLLTRMPRIVPGMPHLTYDIRKDPLRKQRFGNKPIWFALAFYMKSLEGEPECDCYEFAHNMWKSISTGINNLKSVTLANGTPLFVTSHDVGNKNIEVITFNGNHTLDTGRTVAEVADARDKKRWEAVTLSRFKKLGISDVKSQKLTSNIEALIDRATHKALKNKPFSLT